MQRTKHKVQRRVPLWAIRCGFLVAIISLATTQMATVSRLNERDSNQFDSRARLASEVATRHGGREMTERNVRVLWRHHTRPASGGSVAVLRRKGGDAIAPATALLDQASSTLLGATESQHSLRDCKVVIINQHVDFHYEVLESVVALYPLPKIATCNHMKLQFTASISISDNPRYQRKSDSWREYAMTNIAPNDYVASVTPGQSRRLVNVLQTTTPLNDTLWDTAFDYQISASCYCDPNLTWLFKSTSHYCLFHGACDPTFLHQNAPNRIQWVHPSFGKYSFFPNYLPEFSIDRTVDGTTHHLCVIGNVIRRQYDLVALYLTEHPSNLRIHHFGLGVLPNSMMDFAPLIQVHSTPDFLPWQYDLYSTCDAILSLLTRQNQSEYFEGKTKLSGALVQASVYQIPVLLHHDLAMVYKQHLRHVETHTDDPSSFVIGMDRLLKRLVFMKGVQSEQWRN
jgi:hypothetical protein